MSIHEKRTWRIKIIFLHNNRAPENLFISHEMSFVDGFANNSPPSLDDFKTSCTSLADSLHTSKSDEGIANIEQLASVLKWFTDTLSSSQQDISMDPHQVHFLTIALPKFVEALMKRDYSDKEYHPLVANEFFKNVLSMIAKYACQFPQHSIQNF